MQILVKTLNGKMHSFEVEPNESVEEFKELVKEKLGVPPEDQNLVFKGAPLEDGHYLSEYDVQKDSTLLLLMKVFVETDKEEKITLFVSPSDTVAKLKALLAKELQKGRCDDLRLTFDGKQLEDGRNLSHYRIQEQSVLQLLFQIHVITEEQEGILLYVSSSELVSSVKAKLDKELNIPHNEQRLTYREKKLEDFQRLCDYKIRKNVAVNLFHEFQISVKTPSGKLLTFNVKKHTPVQSLKNMIQEAEHLPAEEQRLMLKGERFQDHKTLGDYKIAERNVVELELLQMIKMQCCYGRFQIPTWPSETIVEIKQAICRKLNITFDKYRLLFQNQEVNKASTVANSGITHGNTLVLEKEITVDVTESEQKFPLTMWPSNRVRDVKFEIEKLLGIKTAEQRLSFNGAHLSDEASLSRLGDRETLLLTLELRRELCAKSFTGEVRSCHIWPSDNVQATKEAIAKEENMATSDVLLLYGRHAVNDDTPMADLCVSRMSPLQILQRPRGFFVTVWNTEENTALCVETKMSANVREMKAEVCRQTGFRNEVLLLFHRDLLLEDDSLLADVGIASCTTITLVKRRAAGTIVTARRKSLDRYEIYAAASTNENEAKGIISKQHGVDAGNLEIIFRSIPLHDEQRFDDQGIVEGSVISVLPGTGEEIHVTVKPAGQPTALLLTAVPSKTVMELKSDIEEKTKVPPGNQFLYFKGDMLNDTNQLSYYNICDYSQLTLVCNVYFCVVSLDLQQTELAVEHTMSVEGLKVVLMKTFCIPKTRQRLLIDGKELLDKESLWNCALLPSQPVTLAIAECQLMWVFVRWNEQMINISVSPSESILDVKMKICKKIGILTEQQVLSYKEETLQDDSVSLEVKGIPENAELILTRSPKIDIIVKVAGTKRISVSVADNATVAEMKTEVEKLAEIPEEQIPELKMYFEAEELNGESRISKCGIRNGSVVTVQPAAGIDVAFSSVCGATGDIKIFHNASLEDVKKAVSEKANLNMNVLGIFVGNKEWKDAHQKRAWQMNIDCSVTIFVSRSDLDTFWLFADAEAAVKGFVVGPDKSIENVSSKFIEELSLQGQNVTFFLDKKN